MSRPSQNTDRKLLKAARRLIPRTGVSELKIREVARLARVNLGMFHYCFGSKRAFLNRLLQEIYEEFFARLTLEVSGGEPPLEKLRKALGIIGRFGRQNRTLFLVLLREAMSGHSLTTEFAAKNMHRHIRIFLSLLEECWQAGVLRRLPPPVALAFLLGGMGTPNLVMGLLEKSGAHRPFGMPVKKLTQVLLSDEMIALRADLLLTAIKEKGR